MKPRSKPAPKSAAKPAAKPAAKSAAKTRCDDAETTAYADSLRRHGQLHEGEGKLPPGATHVATKSAPGKPVKLTRKRFSAL